MPERPWLRGLAGLFGGARMQLGHGVPAALPKLPSRSCERCGQTAYWWCREGDSRFHCARCEPEPGTRPRGRE